mmetsp:Transcript_39505/g.63362  ORF Transcript_39505/g.63362 Transcript_39505/m.63362 type:complete len:868 (+) Transcript_39505:122-2725(+)
MAYLFRSEDMQYVRITMSRDKAEYFTKRIGSLNEGKGLIHVVDLADEATLKSETMKEYKKRIVASTQNEKRLDEIEKLMVDYNITIPDVEINDVKIARGCNAEFESKWADVERDLKINSGAVKTLQKAICRLEEERYVLQECRDNINLDALDAEVKEMKRNTGRNTDIKSPLLDADIELQGMQSDDQKFYTYICGVIPVAQQIFFTRMLYRLSRGNAFVRYLNIEDELLDPESGEYVDKSVFYIVSIGRGLSSKLAKLCDFFQAAIYTVPNRADEYDNRIREIESGVRERKTVMESSRVSVRKILRSVADDGRGSSPMANWRKTLSKEKILCETLMKTRRYLTMIRMDGWVPATDVKQIKTCVQDFDSEQPGSIAIDDIFDIESAEFKKNHGEPPTYFKTNEFTGIYQGIVNTYGVPKYKEVNPGLFTCVTFPFIFGVMYGDIGHGGALFLAALYFLYYENHFLEQQRRGEMGELMKYAFGARYALILMGFFGFYCGTIYNDFISVPLQVFDSMWVMPGNLTQTNNELLLRDDSAHYPYGIDWNWYHRKNELTFFNSLKMKMSVILGVTQMMFGISLGAFNYVHFGDYLSLYYVWIPQMLFMMCTFGYMCFMIIYKWTIDYSGEGADEPPALIQTMIKMFLSPGKIETPLYDGQGAVQVVLLLIAVATVPVMLLVKPILQNKQHEEEREQLIPDGSVAADRKSSRVGSADQIGGVSIVDDDEKKSDFEHGIVDGEVEEHEEEHSFGAEMIHSGIHTIEFVLGAVSNTASYLRLWALSLAHAQLAKVFWQKLIIEYGAEAKGGMGIVMIVATYAAWFCATFAVLMCMDLLECFLHALRLHWVEFQNKFYMAEGYLFEPFTFETDDADE